MWQKKNKKQRPLPKASEVGYISTVQRLLNNGADIFDLTKTKRLHYIKQVN